MIVWDADPIMASIGPISLRYYGLSWALAFWISYIIFARIFKAESRPLKDLESFALYIIVGTIVGARVGHLFYEPHILLDNPLKAFAIWEGGLASHGGALGIITATALWFRSYNKGLKKDGGKQKSQYTLIWFLDRLTIVAAISGASIRIGNFFNSEINGVETTLPWGVWFKLRDVLPIYRHPAQLYEALWCLVLFAYMYWLYKRGVSLRTPGRMFGLFLILLFTFRFCVEFIKLTQVATEEGMALDIGQILSIPFIFFGVYLFWRSYQQPKSSELA